MLASLSADAIGKIAQFTAQNLTNTAWAFATLAISSPPLLQSVSAEAIKKCQEFHPQNFGNTAWAFAVCAVHDQPLLDAISSEASRNLAGYDLQALTWLADFDLTCRDEIARLLEREVDTLWEGFPATPAGVDGAFKARVKDMGIDNLGAVGDRLLFRRMGFLEGGAAFEERALETMAENRVEDPREDPAEMTFGGPSRHKRVFSYAEYRVLGPCLGAQGVLEGALLQENGARGPHYEERPLVPVQLPVNQRVERSACSEFLLLTELCALIREAGAPEEDDRRSLGGELRIYSTGPSCISCCLALWQFSMRYPGVQVVVGFSQFQNQGTPLLELSQYS
mmetsp:Transcript_67849/g.177946  ORF Transcript_67849/g.177946 Transcript_67849/m.177946 type:complete len:338 (-) Transcript_67849:83-1096(-)